LRSVASWQAKAGLRQNPFLDSASSRRACPGFHSPPCRGSAPSVSDAGPPGRCNAVVVVVAGELASWKEPPSLRGSVKSMRDARGIDAGGRKDDNQCLPHHNGFASLASPASALKVRIVDDFFFFSPSPLAAHLSTDTPPNPCPGPLEACVVGPRRWLMRSAPPSFLAAGEPASATHHLRLEGTLQAHGAFLGRHARCPSVGSGRGQGERGQQPTTQREREDGRKRCDSSTPPRPKQAAHPRTATQRSAHQRRHPSIHTSHP